MTLSEFNDLDEDGKLAPLLLSGECIGYRKEDVWIKNKA